MRQSITKLALLLVLALFTVMTALPPLSMASSAPLEVIIRVNEHGFLDVKGKAIHEHFKIPKNSEIKLTFEHVGEPDEEHEFILLFDSDEEISSGKISGANRYTSIEFHTGEAGELYDIFCIIVDCDGMEHLTDLVLVAT